MTSSHLYPVWHPKTAYVATIHIKILFLLLGPPFLSMFLPASGRTFNEYQELDDATVRFQGGLRTTHTVRNGLNPAIDHRAPKAPASVKAPEQLTAKYDTRAWMCFVATMLATSWSQWISWVLYFSGLSQELKDAVNREVDQPLRSLLPSGTWMAESLNYALSATAFMHWMEDRVK